MRNSVPRCEGASRAREFLVDSFRRGPLGGLLFSPTMSVRLASVGGAPRGSAGGVRGRRGTVFGLLTSAPGGKVDGCEFNDLGVETTVGGATNELVLSSVMCCMAGALVELPTGNTVFGFTGATVTIGIGSMYLGSTNSSL